MTIAVVSAGFAWWGHVRQLEKAKKQALQEERAKYVAEGERAANERRDFAHLKRSLEQLSAGVAHLNEETDKRLDRLESQLTQVIGAVTILKKALPKK